MNIDRDLIKTAFHTYISGFDASNLQVYNKIRHTWHVAENCQFIAQALSVDENLAFLIGVLHDIGRFEQIRVVHGYDDSKGIDHGDYGANLLLEQHLLREFIADTTEDELIRKAVKYHNKYELPDGLSQMERVYCQIIRDADKIDNFRGFHENDFFSFHERTPEQVQDSIISDEIVTCFVQHRTIPFSKIKTAADFFLIPYALYFGLVYDPSRGLALKQGNYEKMLEFVFEKPENREKFDLIKREIREHM